MNSWEKRNNNMPKNEDWMSDVFISELVYVYQAALVCEECGEKIVKKLKDAGQKDTGDAQDFPQGPYGNGGGEADSPNHCDMHDRCVNAVQVPDGKKIGCPLGNPLTNDGGAYVMNSISEGVFDKTSHKRAIGRLWLMIYNYLKPEHLIRVNAKSLPANLGKLLDSLPPNSRVPPEFYTDLEYAYGAALGRDEITLWRAEIDSLGSFENLQTVLLPPKDMPGRTIEDSLDEAWKDGAWD